MTPFENAKVELDLLDGRPKLLLWFPTGAMKAIQDHMGWDITLLEQNEIIRRLGAKNLAVYVWAGLLWEDPRTDLDDIIYRIDWAQNAWPDDVSVLIMQALSRGMSRGNLEAEENAGPKGAPAPKTVPEIAPAAETEVLEMPETKTRRGDGQNSASNVVV